jgi:hypothetical protein
MKTIIGLIALLSSMAAIADQPTAYTESRRKASAQIIGEFDKKGSELSERQYLLFSLNQTIPAELIAKIASSSHVKISAVHKCMHGGGVLAHYLNPNVDLPRQLNEIDEQSAETLKQLSAFRARSQKVNPASAPGSGSTQELTGLSLYCGVEALGAWKGLQQMRSALQDKTYAVEVIDSAARMLPMNVVE